MNADFENFETPRPLDSDLVLAIISLVFILLARPLLAQTLKGTGNTFEMEKSTEIFPGYISPILGVRQTGFDTGSSQSQRSANSDGDHQNLEVQPLPDCKVDDSICIETQYDKFQVDTNPAVIH